MVVFEDSSPRSVDSERRELRVRRIITYGTFDLFRIGHLNLLEHLRALGDHLTVAVSTDQFNRIKDKACSMPFEDRARIIAALRCVDRVIPEEKLGAESR
jgi:cytidyltransferase-like protein